MPEKLIPEMDVFIDSEKFDKLKQPYLEEDGRIHPDNLPLLFKELKQHLKPIERHFAKEASRRPSTIKMHWDTGAMGNLATLGIVSTPPPTVPARQGSSHIDKQNKHLIGYLDSAQGLHILGALRHESEHATQRSGKSYRKDEKRMAAISKRLYDTGEENPHYRNNYAEVKARIAESKLYVAVYNDLIERGDVSVKTPERIGFLSNKHRELIHLLSIDVMKQLNQRNVNILLQEKEMPRIPILPAHRQAHFLEQNGILLYTQAYNEAMFVATQMVEIITQLQKEYAASAEEQLQAQESQEIDKMLTYAQQYQCINDMPSPRPAFTKPVADIQDMKNQLKHVIGFYNVAICIQSAKDVSVLADIQPIPRSYSTDPQLRAQWEAEHPEEHHFETRDSIDNDVKERDD